MLVWAFSEIERNVRGIRPRRRERAGAVAKHEIGTENRRGTWRPSAPPTADSHVASVSIFFPCYNDATTIGGLVERAAATLDELGVDGEIIVVNDGSSDDSGSVLAAASAAEPRLRTVTHERNRGYGGALQSGFSAATCDWVFYTDGDGQYDPTELTNLVDRVRDDVDVVQGYKLSRGDNFARRLIGRAYHHAVSRLFGLRVRDTDCDFRLIRRVALDRIELTETNGAICVELVRQLEVSGARFVEVGVHHYPRASGRSTFFKPSNVARTLRDLVRLWIRLVAHHASTPADQPVATSALRPPSEPSTASWRGVLAPFFVSRAISGTLLVALGMLQVHGTFLSGFGSWDGRWYRAIALHGYSALPHAHHHQTPWPFFPLFPIVMRTMASLGMSVTIAGIVFNHVAFLVALIGIQRLALRHTTRSGAQLAVWLTALGPLSFVFSMLYPSAVFLAASVWAFVWIEQEHDRAAGIAAAVAALSRPNGVVLMIALVIAVGFAGRRVVRIAAPVVVAVGGWVMFNAVKTGDPIRFLDAKAAWHEITVLTLVERPSATALLHVALAGLALTLVLIGRRRIPRSWSWFTMLYLLPSLALGVVGLARYATETFPPYIACGALLERRDATTIRLVFATLIVAQAGCVFYFITRHQLI